MHRRRTLDTRLGSQHLKFLNISMLPMGCRNQPFPEVVEFSHFLSETVRRLARSGQHSTTWCQIRRSLSCTPPMEENLWVCRPQWRKHPSPPKHQLQRPKVHEISAIRLYLMIGTIRPLFRINNCGIFTFSSSEPSIVRQGVKTLWL